MFKLSSLIKLSTGALFLSLLSVTVVSNTALQAQEADENTTIEELTEENNQFIGETVTVRGEIEELESGLAFTIVEPGFLEAEEIIVLNTANAPFPVMPEDEVPLQVTGEVGTFVLADIENQYGLDLSDEIYVEYENTPVIFADSIALSPSPEEITDNPEDYYGQAVAVQGEVGEIKSDNTFTLDEDQILGGEDLLIINLSSEVIPAEEETVLVTGQIRPFIKTEIERDYDLQWDLELEEELEAEYTDKPVLVLDNIYSAAEDPGLLE